MSSPAASAFARQIGGSPGLIDENESRRIEVGLPGEPVPALLQDVRVLLLLGVYSLFDCDLVTVEEAPVVS